MTWEKLFVWEKFKFLHVETISLDKVIENLVEHGRHAAIAGFRDSNLQGFYGKYPVGI